MIIIRFPKIGEKNAFAVAAEIHKPDLREKLSEILSTVYSNEYSARYAKDMEKFIHVIMLFPAEGIYAVRENGKLFKFDIENSEWQSSAIMAEDFIIRETDKKFWTVFIDRFPFARRFLSEVQNVVKNETSNMLSMTNSAKPVTAIDIDTWEVIASFEEQLKKVLNDYLNPQRVDSFQQEIINGMCSSEGFFPVMIKKNGCIDIAVTEKRVITFDDDYFNLVKAVINETFAKTDVIEIYNRIKNVIIYRNDRKREIVGISKYGHPMVEINNEKLISFSDSEYGIELDQELMEEIQSKVDSEQIRDKSNIAMYYFESTQSSDLRIELSTGVTVKVCIVGRIIKLEKVTLAEIYPPGTCFARCWQRIGQVPQLIVLSDKISH